VDDATATGASGGTIAAPPPAQPTSRWLAIGIAAAAVVLVTAGILLFGGFGGGGGRGTPTATAQSSSTPGGIALASTPEISPTASPTAAPGSPTNVAVPSPATSPATSTSVVQVILDSTHTATPAATPGASATSAQPPAPTSTPTSSPTATPIPCDAGLLTSGFGRLWNARLAIQQRLGCPLAGEQGSSIAEQPFEHGSMLWFGLDNTIYVLSDQGAWSAFPSTQQQGEDAPPQERTPVGLVRPVAGFGLVWDTQEQVRQALGWGTEPEAGRFNGARQEFVRGVMLFSETGLGRGKMIYVLYADGRLEQYEDQP